ncbi:TPA: helix-turn-helix domain-containing protein [Salmonella enterica]|nr:helix-turn-helix domain-containing protein [Salmonella enterica]
MNMTDLELNQFKEIADKAFKAELLCALVEDHPHQLTETQVSALASLIKKLTSDIYVCAEHATDDSLIITTETPPAPLYAPYDGSMTIAFRIQIAREKLGMSEDDLAEKLNIHPGDVLTWEDGADQPLAGMVIPLANALKCDPMWLLTGESSNHQSPATPVHQSRNQYSGQQRSAASDHASHHVKHQSQA